MSRTPNSAVAFTKLHFATASPQHRGAFRVLWVDKYSDAPQNRRESSGTSERESATTELESHPSFPRLGLHLPAPPFGPTDDLPEWSLPFVSYRLSEEPPEHGRHGEDAEFHLISTFI